MALFSQEEEIKKPANADYDYHEARLKMTTPPYGLAKVKQLIEGIKYKASEDDSEGEEKLDDKKYKQLSLREKFTYHMIHPESYSQNCDGFMTVFDEHKTIFGYLLDGFGEHHWSERQNDFFKNNKDSVIAIMSESIKRTGKVGLNYKQVIIDINAIAMIPLLTETYKKTKGQKDLDILTLFIMLMKENNYEPFLKSASYKKLYQSDVDYYQAGIIHNKQNEDLIIQRATDFYNASHK